MELLVILLAVHAVSGVLAAVLYVLSCAVKNDMVDTDDLMISLIPAVWGPFGAIAAAVALISAHVDASHPKILWRRKPRE